MLDELAQVLGDDDPAAPVERRVFAAADARPPM